MRFRSAAVLALVGVLGFGQPAVAQPSDLAQQPEPVRGLEQAAHPLRTTEPGGPDADLQAFDRAVGDASVVSLGEATHSSREFVTMQQRVFASLAKRKGFRTFARELSWSTGLLLDDYVLHGTGDLGKIMDREFDTFYQVFDNEEFRALIEWMRVYNTIHRQKLRFMGTDLAFPGRNLFAKVTDYLDRNDPRLRPVVDRLYAGMAPAPGMSLEQFMANSMRQSLDQRRSLAQRAEAVVGLLRAAGPGRDRDAFDWALQHARALAQSFREYAFDTSNARGRADAGRYRDKVMAENTTWWYEHVNRRIMLSNMTPHASYEPIEPELAPETAAKHLRARFGERFLSAGFSFHHGSFNAKDPKGRYRAFRLGAPGPELNEYTLDKVRARNYFVDLRTVRGPAREWLWRTRPSRNIGGGFDPSAEKPGQLQVALGRSYDLLLHLHEVHAAELRSP